MSSKSYCRRRLLRVVSNGLLQDMFEIQRIEIDVDWDSVTETKIELVFIAWQSLDDEPRAAIWIGQPPLVNAAKPPGEWQTLHILFRAPRFDSDGQKIANAKFELVTLNGKMVQENVEVRWPTGSDWRLPESATGPLYLQGDHGFVAYRKVQVRPLSPN